MCHRQHMALVFRQDFGKVNDTDCFQFYMPDFRGKEIDSKGFRMASEYQTLQNLLRFGCPPSLAFSDKFDLR